MLSEISLYSFNALDKTMSGGTPYGASHVENFNSSSELTNDEYDIAKKSGARLAELIKKINSENKILNMIAIYSTQKNFQ